MSNLVVVRYYYETRQTHLDSSGSNEAEKAAPFQRVSSIAGLWKSQIRKFYQANPHGHSSLLLKPLPFVSPELANSDINCVGEDLESKPFLLKEALKHSSSAHTISIKCPYTRSAVYSLESLRSSAELYNNPLDNTSSHRDNLEWIARLPIYFYTNLGKPTEAIYLTVKAPQHYKCLSVLEELTYSIITYIKSITPHQASLSQPRNLPTVSQD